MSMLSKDGMYSFELTFVHGWDKDANASVFPSVWHGTNVDRVFSKENANEERQGGGARVVLLRSMGGSQTSVTDCSSSIKQWKKSWFWMKNNWQRVDDDPKPSLDVPSVYGIASERKCISVYEFANFSFFIADALY
ncbi:hypothetical protein Adt_33279 [Abeliophyllum distichum]|uniref:Uncharacterized protein n=1 Tax=Abeliophyllum distichum TaxID=126358 RepID=A0ABD1QVY0_9LAMI